MPKEKINNLPKSSMRQRPQKDLNEANRPHGQEDHEQEEKESLNRSSKIVEGTNPSIRPKTTKEKPKTMKS